eukprot:m.142380 g.142380  ORF g.142380 m.142380 type:complete len:84 (-) comp17676_c0_seq7:1164-1415(-)
MVGVPCDVVSGCWRQARVREDFLHFVDAVILVQDKPSGRWHQVLNDTDTYLETSATAMIVAAVYGIPCSYMHSSVSCARLFLE